MELEKPKTRRSVAPSTLRRLEEHFDAKSRQGIVLSFLDLKAFCKREGLVCDDQTLRDLRYQFKHTALFASYRRNHHFMTASVLKYGTAMIDLAVFRPKLKKWNDGNGAFLVAVECVSQKLSIRPCKNKKATSWMAAIRQIVELDFDGLVCLISDRDCVVSQRFRDQVKKKWGVSWVFLKSRGHAMKAERQIRYCKERFSVLLASDPEDKSWVKHVKTVQDDYNGRYVTGCKGLKRKDVNKRNYLQALRCLYRLEDPTIQFSVSDSANYSERLAAKLFRYNIGDRVILARRSAYVKGERATRFEKPSVKGRFGPTTYLIVGRRMKHNKDFFVSATYRLSGLDGLWYDQEIRKVDYAE
jgi:hypothetical protein